MHAETDQLREGLPGRAAAQAEAAFVNALVDHDDELRLGSPASDEDLAEAAAVGRALAEAADRDDTAEVDRLDICYAELRDRHTGRARATVMEAFTGARFRRAGELAELWQRRRAAEQATRKRQDLAAALARGALALPHQIVFDLEGCFACAGRGEIHRRGELVRCGGCGGCGKRRSGAGRRAAAALERLAARLLDVPADQVEVGDALLVRGADGELYPQTVAGVEAAQADGRRRFRFANADGSGVAELVHPAGTVLRRAPTDQQQAAILAKTAQLRGCAVRALPVGPGSSDAADSTAAESLHADPDASRVVATTTPTEEIGAAQTRLAKLELVAAAAQPVVHPRLIWKEI